MKPFEVIKALSASTLADVPVFETTQIQLYRTIKSLWFEIKSLKKENAELELNLILQSRTILHRSGRLPKPVAKRWWQDNALSRFH